MADDVVGLAIVTLKFFWSTSESLSIIRTSIYRLFIVRNIMPKSVVFRSPRYLSQNFLFLALLFSR